MKYPDEKVPDPSPPTDNTHYDKENEKYVQKHDHETNNFKLRPPTSTKEVTTPTKKIRNRY